MEYFSLILILRRKKRTNQHKNQLPIDVLTENTMSKCLKRVKLQGNNLKCLGKNNEVYGLLRSLCFPFLLLFLFTYSPSFNESFCYRSKKYFIMSNGLYSTHCISGLHQKTMSYSCKNMGSNSL